MDALTILGGIVYVAFLIVVGSVFNGYALSVLWRWFVVPVFDAPILGIVPAIGIAVVINFIIPAVRDGKKEKEERSLGEAMILGTVEVIFKPLFALFAGWIVHLFM